MEVTNRHILRVFWTHLARYPWLTAAVIVGVVCANVTEILAPLYYKRFIDLLSGEEPSPELVPVLIIALLAILAVNALGWIFLRIAGLAHSALQPHVMADLETSAFRYTLGHSFQFFSNSFAGGIVRKIGRLSRAFDTFSDTVQWRLLPLVVAVVGTMVALSFRSLWLTGIVGVWIVVFLIANYLVSRWKLKYDILRAQKDSEATSVLSDAIANSLTVKLFSGFKNEVNLFAGAAEGLRRLRTFSGNLLEVNTGVQTALMILIEFAIMVYAVHAWAAGTLTLGDFVLIQGLLINLFNKLWDFGRTIRDLYESFADAKEMVEIMETPHEIADAKSAKPLVVTRGKIEFQDVTFRYPKTRRVLEHFDLTIKPKEKVALVGPSGAGKSTVTKLILRLHEADAGQILVDGQAVHRVTQESLRGAIAVVPQEPLLFHRSIMQNIRYGRRDATDEDVIAAAEKANCHDFIMDMPEGYDTFVGERGVKLSGGERQRIAVARAILKDAPILVLDEATASLDSESERLIQDALQDLMQDKTVIVIAHRLSTILQMDRIIVVERGSVSASGTHKELLSKSATYKKLWKIQAGGFIP